MDLQAIIAIVIAYFLYCGVLAGGIQTGINQIKPLFLDPIKARLNNDQQYLIVLYIFRAIITALAYFYLWGGVSATRVILTTLVAGIPDVGIALVTIAVVVLGEEIIHPIIDRLYILRDVAKGLGQIDVSVPVPAPTTDAPQVSASVEVKAPPQ